MGRRPRRRRGSPPTGSAHGAGSGARARSGECAVTARHSAAPSDRPLATPEDLAEFLNDIPVKTLAQWRSRGIGPKYRKVGRHVRYDWAGWSQPVEAIELAVSSGLSARRSSANTSAGVLN